MKYLRNSKERGSAAELRHHPEGPEESLPSDNPSYSYNPFADTDPFSPTAQPFASSSREHGEKTVVREHAVGPPSFSQRQGASPGELERQSPGLHEVSLHDWTPAAVTGGAAGSHLGGGGFDNGLHSTLSSADHIAPAAGATTAGQPHPETPTSSWAKHGRRGAAEAYTLATPSPRPPAARHSVGSQGPATAWVEPVPPPAKKGLRLWGRKEPSPPSPSLPLSHPPSFGAMLPPPGDSVGVRNDGGRRGSRSAPVMAQRTVPVQAAALERRERELVRREADIARREAALTVAGGTKAKNWPRCYPILHHDIIAEVPAGRQRLVGIGYLTWILVCTAYLYNWLLITIMFGCGDKSVSIWLFASLVAMAGVPLSFLCWYRMLYFAAITDGAARWTWFFINMAVNIFWNWWMFVGVEPKLGGYSAGVFTVIEQFTHGEGRGTAFGVLSIINMLLWGLGGLLSICVLGWGMRVFRGRDQAG